MADSIRRVAILGGMRIPFARSNTAYVDLTNLGMLTAALTALVDRFGLRGQRIGEVAAGAVIKHTRDAGMAREATLGCGLHPHTPAYDVQRACGTSLTALVQIAHRISRGEIECGIAGGTDSASDIPITYGRKLQQALLESARGRSAGERIKPWLRLRPRDFKPSVPAITEPSTGLSMGEHTEMMAKEWGIGRREQDELANASHVKAAAAWKEGFFDDLVVPFGGLKVDNNLRADSTVEKLSRLQPSFDRSAAGTLTAGNSTPLTDGASSVLVASEDWAKQRGLPVQAYLTCSAAAAVDFVGTAGPREGLLMAPTYAVPDMLDRMGITLLDFDLYEIHEAFAAQVLCNVAALENPDFRRQKAGVEADLGGFPWERFNPHGGSVALGHPFGATGARILSQAVKELAGMPKGSRAVVSICADGGLGTVALLQSD
jgi:acetyl-CoA C-acetyltransferase